MFKKTEKKNWDTRRRRNTQQPIFCVIFFFVSIKKTRLPHLSTLPTHGQKRMNNTNEWRVKKTHSHKKNINPHCFFYPSLNNTKISTHRELSRREIHVYSFGISWKRKIRKRKKKNKNKVIFFRHSPSCVPVCMYVCTKTDRHDMWEQNVLSAHCTPY